MLPIEDVLADLPDLSDLDPSTHGGYKTIFFRDVPLELRLQTTDAAPAEAGTLEAISCKVLIKEGEDGRPRAVKVELSSEGDLFFHYSHVVDERQFNAMRDEQKLMVDFASYPSVLASSLTNAIKEPHTFLAVFIMNRDGQARLDFIQNVSFKFIELLSVMFGRSSDDTIRQQIAFRYNTQKSKVAVLQARLQDIVNLVKVKNPSLLLQLQKPAGGGGGATMGAGGSVIGGAGGAAVMPGPGGSRRL